MSNSSNINYITDGPRYGRGWNKFEPATIKWLIGILVVAALIGGFLGLLMGLWLQWSALTVILLVFIGAGIFLMMGSALAKGAVIPFIWENMLAEWRKVSGGMKGGQISHSYELFPLETFTPAFSFITPLTLGLLKLHQLHMKKGYLHLVNVGFNDFFVYDLESAGHSHMVFWKLNLTNAPVMEARSFPRDMDVAVRLDNIPSFDPKFDEGVGGWVKLSYQVQVKVEVLWDRVESFCKATHPLTTVEDAARRAARRVLPYATYEAALIGEAEEKLEQEIIADPKVQAIGLEVKGGSVQGIEGSQMVDEAMSLSFKRMGETKDRRKAALLFSEMDREIFQRMLEAEKPEAALQLQARATDQMMQAMLVSGLNPIQAYKMTGQLAQSLGQPVDSLAQQITGILGRPVENTAGQVAGKLLTTKIKPEDWDKYEPLEIPQGITHEDRLQWERNVLQERLPTQLQPCTDPGLFIFKLETEDELKIRWDYNTFSPTVHINGQNRSADYTALKENLYDYQQITVWDIYMETRRLLK